MTPTPSAIDWPTIKVGQRIFWLRYNYAANYQLNRWGLNLASATTLELSAAMASEPDAAGDLHNCGFPKPTYLADLVPEGENPDFRTAVAEAIKKVRPELGILFEPVPAKAENPETTSSAPGPSPEAPPA